MVLPRSKIPSGKFKATCHWSGLLVGRGLLYFWRHPTLVHGLFLSHCPPSSNEFDWDHITTSMSLRATWCLAFVKIVMHLCKSITMMIYSCGQVILAANCYYICLCRFHFAIKLLGHSSDTIMCSFFFKILFCFVFPSLQTRVSIWSSSKLQQFSLIPTFNFLNLRVANMSLLVFKATRFALVKESKNLSHQYRIYT